MVKRLKRKRGRSWIKKAIKHPGGLHRALHVPEGQKIPAAKLAAARRSSDPHLRRMANFAVALGKMHHR